MDKVNLLRLYFPLLGLALWVSGCVGGGEPLLEQKARMVRVAVVKAGGGVRTRTFSGSARAGHESRLSFRVSGTIRELPIKLGDKVKKGQVLARLDDKDYVLQVQQAEAGLNQANAQERNATASYERTRGLYENNNASINDLDRARAAMESAQAQVSSLQKQLELARSQLSYTTLMAPLDGSIADLMSEVNENAAAGQAIAILNAGARPETTFLVPEQLIRQVREGEAVTIRFDSLPGEEFSGTITEVGIAAGGVATTFPVRATLDMPNDEVRQGMATEVSMSFGSPKRGSQIFVKPKAVVEDAKGRFVYVAEGALGELGTVARRAVVTGDLTEDGLEIKEGLQVGELLITAGLRFLKEGREVRIPDQGE